MKSLNIILLCAVLLIQGISQSYASQMMSSMASSPVMNMQDMPCHEGITDASLSMDECCDEHCQCDAMASAMIVAGFILSNSSANAVRHYFKSSFFFSSLKSLYRPPIVA